MSINDFNTYNSGTIALQWTLKRYIKSSLGNYYYIYQIASGDFEGGVQNLILDTTWCATKNTVYYGSKAAISATRGAVSASVFTGKVLIMTVTQSC